MECKEHGRFEVSRRFDEIKDVRCPTCGGTTKKLMSNFVFANYPVKSVKLNGEEIR